MPRRISRQLFAVTEIFYSIQGESTHAGRPCVFVRFTGCNLRCSYCDTTYAFTEGRRVSQADILDEVSKYPTKLVALTGGEPLLQPELPELTTELLERGFEVLVETHGQLPWAMLPERVIKIVDVKTPGSGEPAREEMLDWLEGLSPSDEIKFVVASEEDFRWAVEVIRRRRLMERPAVLLFSAVLGKVEPKELAKWLLESGVNARLQLQLHKILWGSARGV